MISQDFYEQFERENQRFERKQYKQGRCKKKVEGFGEVTGTFRNQEGQEMARALFYLNYDRLPNETEMKDYFQSVTKGHEIPISELYVRQVAEQLGKEYAQKNPNTIINILESQRYYEKLINSINSWNGFFFSAQATTNQQISLHSEIFDEQKTINPSEDRITLDSGLVVKCQGDCLIFPISEELETVIYISQKRASPRLERELKKQLRNQYKNGTRLFENLKREQQKD